MAKLDTKQNKNPDKNHGKEQAKISFSPARTVRYVGQVARITNERILSEIQKLHQKSPEEEIALFVTSTGGATGTAMSFYDTIRHIICPNLVSIGSGDVDSAGIIIFLSGKKRYVTRNTTLLFHLAGRIFPSSQRFTVHEAESMLAEDRLKDDQYASLVAENSQGLLSKEAVIGMMENQTVLSPQHLVEFGLADAVLL